MSVHAERSEDPRLVLAFDAAVARLQQQDTTLGNLRTRASNLLVTAALLTSFAAGVGLISADATKGQTLPGWAAVALVAILMLVGTVVLIIHWPFSRWAFGASSQKIMTRIAAGDDIDAIRTYVVGELIQARNENDERLHRCSWLYRIAVALLVLEVAILAAGLHFAS